MAIQDLPLVIQTSYAELVDQLRLAVASGFAEGSTFRKRAISGKTYWYIQEPTTPTGRPPERYLGADTDDLRSAIERATTAKSNADGRRAIRRSLAAGGLPEPDSFTGSMIEALAQAGVFRLRGVIVGTVAFQTYAGHLGVRLPSAAIRTGDLDIAQDYGVSVALDDKLDQPLFEILKTVDPAFTPVSTLTNPLAANTFSRPGGYRVDILTTNRGADSDTSVRLPSLQADALPLRYLDFLLRDTIETAALTRFGTLVNVPSPERYAVHKMIVSTLRKTSGESAVKSDKDLVQSGILVDALILKKRHDDLADVLREAVQRGTAWKDRLKRSAARLDAAPREFVASVIEDA
jgi:hypothetical protein